MAYRSNVTDDVGLQLLAAFEALAAEVREAVTKLDSGKEANRKRQQKHRDKKRNVTPDSNVTRNVTPQVLKALDLGLDQRAKEQEPAGSNVTPDYSKLVTYSVEAIAKATGRKYKFNPEDGKHVKSLLKDFGVAGAQEVVDLAIERYQSEPFHKKRGVTLRLIATDANALRTSRPQKPSEKAKEQWKDEGFYSKEEWESYRAGLEAIV